MMFSADFVKMKVYENKFSYSLNYLCEMELVQLWI